MNLRKEDYEPPAIIYHYTNEAGLYGILDSQCLWATHYKGLNDKREVRYTMDLLNKRLNLYSKRNSEYEILANMFVQLQAIFRLPEYPFGDSNKIITSLFVTSFSSAPNSEFMWKKDYTEKGKGYALAFDTEELKSMLVKELNSKLILLNFSKVEYWESKQRKLIDMAIKRCIESPNTIADNCLMLSTGLKSIDWIEENEVRISVFYESRFMEKFKDNPKGKQLTEVFERNSVPYLKLPYNPVHTPFLLPIKEIIIGPAEGYRDRLEKLRNFLDRKRLAIPIMGSACDAW